MTLAGLPATTEYGGTSLVTTLPAPMTAPSLPDTCSNVVLVLIHVKWPTLQDDSLNPEYFLS